MKKIGMALVFALLLLIPSSTVFAGGELTIFKQNMVEYESGEGSWELYFYAVLENTGDELAKVDKIHVSVFDPAGEVVVDKDASSLSPRTVAPGEHAIYTYYTTVKEVEAIGDYQIEVTSQNPFATDKAPEPFEVSSEFEITPVGDKNDIFAILTVKNNSETISYNTDFAYAVYDQNGELIFADTYAEHQFGLIPGQEIAIKRRINNHVIETWKGKDIVPTTVEAIVYPVS